MIAFHGHVCWTWVSRSWDKSLECWNGEFRVGTYGMSFNVCSAKLLNVPPSPILCPWNKNLWKYESILVPTGVLWREMRASKAVAWIHIAVVLVNLISYILSLVWTAFHQVRNSSHIAGGISSTVFLVAFQVFPKLLSLLPRVEPGEGFGGISGGFFL